MIPRPPILKSIPKMVTDLNNYILSEPSHELRYIAEKLIPGNDPTKDEQLEDNPVDLVGMWLTLENRSNNPEDDLWVWSFLRSAEAAYNLPSFHNKNALGRKELSDSILKLTRELSSELTRNDLDCHFVSLDGVLFNGFYIYEDFGDSNRERIDDKSIKKMKFSDLLKFVAERSKKKIDDEPIPGKSGKNANAIRFARLIVDRNYQLYRA